MIHYLYMIVHTNGRYYVGRHSTKNLNDGYMGSGKWPLSIINKTELTKKILSYHYSPNELIAAEKTLLSEHIGKPLCMNFNNNPTGFASGDLNPAKSEKEKLRKSKRKGELNSMFGKTHTDESKHKMSISRKGKSTWNKGLTNVKTSDKGQTAWNKGIRTGYKSFTGKSHTKESVEKMKLGHSTRTKIECPYCGRIIDKPNYTRYHGEKCKFNQ